VLVGYRAVKGAMRCGAAALLALAVCACAEHDKPKRIEENVSPADFRTQVADQVRRQLAPRNIQDAYIAEPVLKSSLSTPRYVACVRFNSTDNSGASKGNKYYAAYFYAGKITGIVDATVEQCDKAAFLPFPELQ
jgi:Flp pilus assembly protein TadD